MILRLRIAGNPKHTEEFAGSLRILKEFRSLSCSLSIKERSFLSNGGFGNTERMANLFQLSPALLKADAVGLLLNSYPRTELVSRQEFVFIPAVS